MSGDESDDGLREVVMEVILDAGDHGVTTFGRLLQKAALGLERRAGIAESPFSLAPDFHLPPGGPELALEAVWDLARRGIVTFCPESSTASWPGFRRSRFAECARARGDGRPGADKSFIKVPLQTADLSHATLVYLNEAVAAFYMDCLLSTCVLLALAAEDEFLSLLRVAKSSAAYGRHFARISDGENVAAKIGQFKEAMRSIRAELPETATDELDHNFEAIQLVIRTARNDAGKPSGARPLSRDQVHLHIQLFIPFARQAKRLRQELHERSAPRVVRLH